MKKIFLLLFALVVLVGAFTAWKIFGPSVIVPEGKFLYIKTGETYPVLKEDLQSKGIIKNPVWFDMVAQNLDYKNSVKAGKYEIKKGMSLFELVRMLRGGRQTPVNLVITKFRIKENFAGKAGKMFEFDSLQMIAFLSNNDSLKTYGLDTNTVLSAVLPDTYTYYWNTTPKKVFLKLFDASQKFWNDARKKKADSIGLSPVKVSTLASIIDEESNYAPEKSNIASVYLNRLSKNIPLQADPTVKFALKDFGLKRIYEKHLMFESPYNTYRNAGLPPGPICTPQTTTLDAVLNAPKTDYLYFVAKSDFSGAHVFAANYDDHLKYAKEYQEALNREDSIRKANQ
jgi:peptidoglycan lytic transglycosylase G